MCERVGERESVCAHVCVCVCVFISHRFGYQAHITSVLINVLLCHRFFSHCFLFSFIFVLCVPHFSVIAECFELPKALYKFPFYFSLAQFIFHGLMEWPQNWSQQLTGTNLRCKSHTQKIRKTVMIVVNIDLFQHQKLLDDQCIYSPYFIPVPFPFSFE